MHRFKSSNLYRFVRTQHVVSFLITTTLILLTITIYPQDDASVTYAYTNTNPDGNKYIADISGAFPDVDTTTIELGAVPLWIVGGEVNGIATWVVALDNGSVMTGQPLADGFMIEINSVTPGTPIAAKFSEEGLPQLLQAGDDISPLTNPVVINTDDETLVYVADNGDLVLWRDGDELAREALNMQPDARPVISDTGLIAVYVDSTNSRYVHGIMGDDLEGASLVVLSVVDDAFEVVSRVDLDGEDVFEGIFPMWADVNDDGEQEIVTTTSNGQVGAFIEVYSANGDKIGQSRGIGQGNRWRHQLAAAPFGLEGETQIVDILTPHIGGMVEFFTLRDGELSVNNAQLGFTSHSIGSRNLDMGIAGDFDGDGKPELVVTDQARSRIAGVTNTTQGVQEVWTLPLDGRLTTNLTAIVLSDGQVALAAGTENGVLHVWQSQ